MPQKKKPVLSKSAAQKCFHGTDILDMEGQALICCSGVPGAKHTALVKVGHGKMRLQVWTREGFECSQIQAAARTAVQIEQGRTVLHPALNADMEAHPIDRGHIMGFR